MVNLLSRVTLIKGTPPCQPGKCIICGNCGGDDSTKFLDFGLEIDFYGVVYFCTTCIVGDLLEKLELKPQADYDFLQDQYDDLKTEVEVLMGQNYDLRRTLESLAKLGYSDFNDSSSIPVESDVSSTDKESAETNRKSTGRKTRSPKQTNESGSESLYNTSQRQQSQQSGIEFEL